MVRVIVWKEEAEDQLDLILRYLFNEISESSAEKLYREISSRLLILSKYPESGNNLPEHPGIRYAQIRKSHYLYYTFDEGALYIIAFFGVKSPDNPFR